MRCTPMRCTPMRCTPSDPSYRGQLGEGTEGPRRRGQGGSSLEGAGKWQLRRKGSRKEVEGGGWRHTTRQRAPIPSFLPVHVLVNHIAVNKTDPYDSDSSDGVPSSLCSPQSPNPLLSTIPIMRRTNTASSS
jgi:hypothetical protein